MRRAAIAVLAGGAVFAALLVLVVADPTPGVDVAAHDLARDGARPVLLDIAGGPLDLLAEPATIVALACVAAVVLARTGRRPELVAMATGLALTGFGGSLIKAVVERPRPPDTLDESVGFAFPSGHARFGVLWLWVALTLASRPGPARGRRRAILAVGLALTLLTGSARVYVRAHWLTDVVAGWAFSVAAFGVGALVAGALGRSLLDARRGEP